MLDLFEKVEIKKVDRLDTEDLTAIKNLQERFNNDKAVYEQLAPIVDSLKTLSLSGDFKYSTMLEDLRKRLQESTKDFIADIYRHFRYKYQVEIKDNLWNEDKFRWHHISNATTWEKCIEYVYSMNYDKVLDDIYSQLGTLNFADKGKQEFIELVKNKLGYKMEHKNDKVSFNNLVYQDSWDTNNISYSSSGNFEMMFKSINFYENDNYSLTTWASNFYDLCKRGRAPNFFTFSTHTNLPFSDIEHIKIFKNGKVELKFSSYEEAKKYFDMFYRAGRN